MRPGQVGWIDLTLEDAPRLRDFYAEGVAGICHSRGSNANQPPGWMIYIVVEDLGHSVTACESLGGRGEGTGPDHGRGQVRRHRGPGRLGLCPLRGVLNPPRLAVDPMPQ